MRRPRVVAIIVLASVLALGAARPAASALLGGPVGGFTHTSWTDFGDPVQPTGVYAITQDRDGYMWIGFLGGLVRFDGQQFVRWEALGRATLPQRPVTALHAGHDGSLWIGFGNLGGVSQFKGGTLRHFTPRDGLPEGAIRQFVETRAGVVWASGFGGLSRLTHGRWERIGLTQGVPEAAVDLIYEDHDGDLWVASQSRIFRFSASSDRFVPVPHASPLTPFGPGVASAVPTDIMRAAFARIDPSVQPVALRSRSGQFWLSVPDGLLALSESPGAPPRAERLTQRDGLTNSRVTALFEDREGNIWIGTVDGLDALTIRRPSPIRILLDGQNVFAVATRADGTVWSGTSEGLHERGPAGERWYRQADGLPGPIVTALHTSGSELWVATTKGLAKLTNGHLAPVAIPGAGPLTRVVSMTTDRTGILWLAEFGGLHRLKDGVLTEAGSTGPLAGRRPSVVYTDEAGTVWIGFWGGGLAAYRNGRFELFGSSDGLSAGRVTSIQEDHNHRLWVGTLNGFSRRDGARFTTLSEASGLSGLMVAALLDDGREAIWVATLAGLLRLPLVEFDRAAGDATYRPQYSLFGAAEGIRESFVVTPPIRTSDGALTFARHGGLAQVSPGSVRPRPGPPVRIEQLTVNDRPYDVTGPLTVPAGTSRIQVDYTALTFMAPPRFQFRYMLEGFDRDWVHAGTSRRAVYTNLPPRTYRFRVAASHDGSEWSESPAPLALTVEPAFYQQTWFSVALAGLTVLAVALFWRLRLRRVRQQYALVLAERARLGREIHDTLLQGMVGVALQLHGLSETLAPGSETLKQKLDRAREFLEHYIRETRLSIWDLRSPSLERRDLAGALREAGTAITAGTDVALELTVEGMPAPCDPRVEEHLLRIGHEAMANAIRHGRATTVRVGLCYTPGHIALSVRDDGQGFDATEVAHQSGRQWGLTTMRERAQQIGATFQCASSSTGTVIEATAPIPQVR